MESLNSLLYGFGIALSFQNIIFCLIGVTLGTLVGVLPGLGGLPAMSLLLPLTFTMDPIAGIIMMSGLLFGAQYGGSTTSILLKIPGEPSALMATLDGHEMARNGKAGVALSIAAIGSFFAGIIAACFVILSAVPLSKFATEFGPAEYASLMMLGLIVSITLGRGNFIKSSSMMLLGVLIGLIGVDVNSGLERFTFDIPDLYDGISFAIISMGLFGISEILYYIFHYNSHNQIPKITNFYPTKEDMKQSALPIMRGSILGSILGVLPGVGAFIGSAASYSFEKALSKHPDEFGKGTIEGVAGPESANNASAQTHFIPLLSLGIPTTPVMALFMAGLLVHEIVPGPGMIANNSDLFWTFMASMFISNVLLVILNLPLIKIWVSILMIPKYLLYSTILIICFFATYYITGSIIHVFLLIPLGIIGYFLKVWGYEIAPLAMGFVIGPHLEEYVRRSLIISDGNWLTFFSHPISISLMCISICVIIIYTKTMKKHNY